MGEENCSKKESLDFGGASNLSSSTTATSPSAARSSNEEPAREAPELGGELPQQSIVVDEAERVEELKSSIARLECKKVKNEGRIALLQQLVDKLDQWEAELAKSIMKKGLPDAATARALLAAGKVVIQSARNEAE